MRMLESLRVGKKNPWMIYGVVILSHDPLDVSHQVHSSICMIRHQFADLWVGGGFVCPVGWVVGLNEFLP